ncbi:MAG: T9SS type A sorting domain-containing protein, partial [Bacteroidia bacterium]
HNYGRNWSLAGGLDGSGAYAGRLDITNNVVYNWGARTTDGGAHEVNFVNNYYKPGAGSTRFFALVAENEGAGTGTQQYFFDGNVMPGRFDETNQTSGRIKTGVPVTFDNFVDSAFFPSYVTTQTARHAYKIVLSDVGCNQPAFDYHDERMIAETLAGTYSVVGSVTGKKGFPDDEADAGGYENYPVLTRDADWDSDSDGLPDWYETVIGTDLNSPAEDFSDTNADLDLDGYTNMDDYLQWMDQPNFSTVSGSAITINLQKLSRGFTNDASYTVSNLVNGTYTLTGEIIEFTPTAIGIGSFDFTVTDSVGDSMTRTVNILNGYDLGTLSVENQLSAQVKVWPVPNDGSFFIEVENPRLKSVYTVFDMLGKEVVSGSVESGETKEVRLPSHARGLFFVQVMDRDSKEVIHWQKVVVR